MVETQTGGGGVSRLLLASWVGNFPLMNVSSAGQRGRGRSRVAVAHELKMGGFPPRLDGDGYMEHNGEDMGPR